MNYKIQSGLKKSRKVIIFALILWLILTIVLILPFTYCKGIASESGKFNLTIFMNNFTGSISKPFTSISYLSENNLWGSFFSSFIGMTIVYTLFFVIGFIRNMPKHQYDDIEHGSSDWSEHGEQYQILSNKKGIILQKIITYL